MGACTRILDLFKTPTFIMKIVELVLGLACVGLVSGHALHTVDIGKQQTVYATVFGFFVLEVVIILGLLIDYPLHRIVVLVICFAATIMFIISGGFMIEMWAKRKTYYVHKNVLAAGILSLFNGIAYGLDVFLTFMKCRSGSSSVFGEA